MVAIQSASLFVASIALLSSYVHAYGQIAQVVDADNFCVFLPPSDSVDRGIAETEWNAQAFCEGNTPLAIDAGKLDSGFIKSAHYLATDKYVQVTGQINPRKARLNVTDEGGQYDIKAPKGSSCAGWKFYVNLVEPVTGTYCMRCCNDDRSCNRGISEKGCAHIIPGDYSGPSPKGSKKSKTTTIASPSTTTDSTSAATTAKSTSTASIADAAPTADAADATRTTSATGTAPTPASNDNSAILPAVNASSSPSALQKNERLSQNDQVSEQSVNGAGQFRPTLIVLTAGLVTMAVTLAQ